MGRVQEGGSSSLSLLWVLDSMGWIGALSHFQMIVRPVRLGRALLGGAKSEQLDSKKGLRLHSNLVRLRCPRPSTEVSY